MRPLLILLLLSIASLAGDNFTRFRGADATGVATDRLDELRVTTLSLVGGKLLSRTPSKIHRITNANSLPQWRFAGQTRSQ